MLDFNTLCPQRGNNSTSIVELKLTIGRVSHKSDNKIDKILLPLAMHKNSNTNLKILQRIHPCRHIAGKKILIGLAARERGFTSIIKIKNSQSVIIQNHAAFGFS